jgi:hypothetical protein
MEKLGSIWEWLFSRQDRVKPGKNPSEKLQMSMRVTAKCRYNAAIRLQHQGKFAFFTTTVLSLGLIFIPLMQNSSVPLAFQPNVLNMMQIFLAVAVLVYSVVIGTARYELRAENLTECGDKLKELSRSLDKQLLIHTPLEATELEEFQQRYSDIVTDTENHTRSDYRLAMLDMVTEYFFTGLPRLGLYISAYAARSLAYLVPLSMLIVEVIFITDMINLTHLLSPHFGGVSLGGERSGGS